ncbi:MAG: hypothetical protein RI519_05040 [Balneolaceae bacterium]|nr:hypothetical protein [Balneolaceae bacterium]
MIQVNFNSLVMSLMIPFRAFSCSVLSYRVFAILTLLFAGLLGVMDVQAQLGPANEEPAISPNAGFTIAGNVVNATTTGAVLGLATMALEDRTDYQRPLSVGVGVGMLAGVGLSIYDLASVSPGETVMRRGLFASGSNTSLLLVMDTIYGATLGSIVGTAVILVSGDELTHGLQYGAATGAFVGATFGLMDAFLLDFGKSFEPGGSDNDMPPLVEAWSRGVQLPDLTLRDMPRSDLTLRYTPQRDLRPRDGIEHVDRSNRRTLAQTRSTKTSLHFLQPTMNTFKSVDVAPNSGRGVGTQRVSVGVELLSVRVSL